MKPDATGNENRPATPQSIWEKYSSVADKKLSAVPKLVRPVVTTYGAQGVIDNGGFPYLFENNWPGITDWNIFADDFEAIGHTKGAEAIRAALRLFPQGQPQTDLKERRKHIFEALGGLDGELGKLDGAICGESEFLEQLLVRYIATHQIT